jgi:hypothetical protein
MHKKHHFYSLSKDILDIKKTEYYAEPTKIFCKRYKISPLTCIDIFWRKPVKRKVTHTTAESQLKYQADIKIKYDIEVDLLFKKTMDKFKITKIFVKKLLNKYTFTEILRADNINNIKHLYYIR